MACDDVVVLLASDDQTDSRLGDGVGDTWRLPNDEIRDNLKTRGNGKMQKQDIKQYDHR